MFKRFLSAALAAFLLLSMTACGEKKESQAENSTKLQIPSSYTAEEKSRYYQQLDAILLAAAVYKADPDSASCSVTEQAEGLYLNMTVQATPVRFALQTPQMEILDTVPAGSKGFALTSQCYDAVNSELLLQDYMGHLVSLGATAPTLICSNLDGDSPAEYLLVVENLAEQWLGTLTDTQSAGMALEDITVCLLADADEQGHLVCHGVVLPEYVTQIRSASWDNGMVHILYGENELYRIFAGECAVSLEHYDQNEQLLRRMCTRYITYLEDQGYTDVNLRLADISDVPGKEVVCCYSNGEYYTAAVLIPYRGRLQPLYISNGNAGALFVIDAQQAQYLLEYVQQLESDYSQSYRYQLFRFGQTFDMEVEDQAELEIAADQGGGEKGTSFFDKLNGFLQKAQVCYDPYVLTGYEVMQDEKEQESIRPEEKYLRITNCSTNKVGTVKINNPNSWLNFRTGPSTEYDLVRIDPTDPNSFVKQVLGAPMTVIEPINTGDSENPVWVRIRISYHGRTLEGYSAQRYVQIDGIRHVPAGESVSVMAETNDTDLRWSSSDTSVASIDPNTGKLTAIREGLVLVTVTSASGLEDSCLIMVD